MNIVADISTQFSGTQGGAGWQYGRFPQGNPAGFTTSGMTYSSGSWLGPNTFSTPILQVGFMHPGSDNSSAVFAWTSTVAATVTATFSATHGGGSSDGVKIQIWLGTSLQIESAHMNGTAATITATFTVAIGDVIYFDLDCLGDFGTDGTTVQVLQVSAPDSSLLPRRRRAA